MKFTLPTPTRSLLMLALACCAWSAAAAQFPAESQPLDIELALHQALFQQEAPTGEDPSLLLDLSRAPEGWKRAWGTARNFNPNWHAGRVVSAKQTPEALQLSLSMLIVGDGYTQGGRAFYDVSLKADADRIHGTYSGSFRGQSISGKVSGRIKPIPAAPKGFTPLKPGEHPRLLFRKADLPGLREKAKTPFGQAALKAMGNEPASHALRYQLTGDRSHADAARAAVEPMLDDFENGSKFIRSRIWGWRLEQIALAYDMCYDAWPDDFKQRVRDYSLAAIHRIAYQRGLFHKEISWNMTAHYPATIVYGSAISALNFLNDTGPEPAPPPPPFADRDPYAPIAPASGYSVPDGVPTVAFTSNTMPTEWIWAGAFKHPDADPLAEHGGPAKLRPQPGLKLSDPDQTAAFAPIDSKAIYIDPKYTGGNAVLEVTALHRTYHSTTYFYTVLKNDKPRWVRYRADHGGARAYLAGVHIREDTCLQLQPGSYPLLVAVRIGETNPWGRIFLRPRFEEITDAAAKQAINNTLADYQHALDDWQAEVDLWKRSGQADPALQRAYELTHAMLYRAVREGINDGGFQLSTSYPMGLDGLIRYATIHQNVTGRPLSPFPDLGHYLPCKLFSALYRPDGSFFAQDINGTANLTIPNVYHETRDMASDFYASLYPIIPPELQPAALWAWNWHTRTEPGQPPLGALVGGKRPYSIDGYNALPLYAFIHYPLDATPKHPDKALPKAWLAHGAGYYAFRNHHQQQDDIIVQVYAKTRGSSNDRESAGTLRIIGFGEVWSHGLGPAAGARFSENVVQLLDDPINPDAAGIVLHADAHDDGSGSVSIDLADVYAGNSSTDPERPKPLYDIYGSIRRPWAFKDLGIRGMRAIAVDYSGKSGAPAMVVIVDRITGGGPKTWTWQIESGRTSVGRAKEVGTDKDGRKIVSFLDRQWSYRAGHLIREDIQPLPADPAVLLHPRGFTLTRGPATLHATFITPDPLQIQFAQRDRYTQTAKSGVRKDSSKALFATGGDHYFAILTLQTGEPPKVELVSGKGLDAVVRVGGQTVRFDGKQVIFGQ